MKQCYFFSKPNSLHRIVGEKMLNKEMTSLQKTTIKYGTLN